MNSGSQYLYGGYGNDTIFVGSDNTGADLVIFGDLGGQGAAIDFMEYAGLPKDGNDIIDIGDNNVAANGIVAYGQGGNDKLIGGIGHTATLETLYGGDGDDKVWAHNPEQFEDTGMNYLFGNDGNDIIYGS